MYGVPPDLPLDRFVGHDLDQVSLGQCQIQFHFAEVGSIDVEAHWELRGPEGNLVDAACPHAERDCYRIHHLIGVPVTRFAVDPPRSLTLFFESGHALTVFDDSGQWESFSVHPDGEESSFL